MHTSSLNHLLLGLEHMILIPQDLTLPSTHDNEWIWVCSINIKALRAATVLAESSEKNWEVCLILCVRF